jgi:putative transposase
LIPNCSLSDLVRDIKANSARFINEKKWFVGRFSWQEGFGAFSYSRSHLDTVIRYIQNQRAHHARQSFRDEYVQILKGFNVDYDSRFLFEDNDK